MYERFVELLKESNLTAFSFAKESGVAYTTLSRWKQVGRPPGHQTMQKIADYFAVNVNWLYGTSEVKYAPPVVDTDFVISDTDIEWLIAMRERVNNQKRFREYMRIMEDIINANSQEDS